jgi:hypothetical protein
MLTREEAAETKRLARAETVAARRAEKARKDAVVARRAEKVRRTSEEAVDESA